MHQATIIGIDLAKRTFQAHGATSDGKVAFRKKLSRSQLLAFLTQQPRCVVAMEACATAHGWGRAARELGHEVRLVPPAYVKPFVKRQKNDAADAEAIAEAASRPTMRFVAVKSEAQQARAMVFRTRDLLVRQRTQLITGISRSTGSSPGRGRQTLSILLTRSVTRRSRFYRSSATSASFTLSRSRDWARRSRPWTERSGASRKARRRHACRPCQGWVRSRRWPLRRSRPP